MVSVQEKTISFPSANTSFFPQTSFVLCAARESSSLISSMSGATGPQVHQFLQKYVEM
jgi:hypothetical protein